MANGRAVVTGAGSGIGRAVARRLSEAGYAVLAVGRRADLLAETASGYDSLRDDGGLVEPLAADVTEESGRQAVLAAAGAVDVLVNCAGANVKRRSVAETSPEDWDSLIAVNLTAAFRLMQAVLPGMAERGGGLVINISSVSGVRAYPLGGVAYCASKFGLQAATSAAANEFGPKGVRCTAILPGEVDTPILEQRPTPVPPERRRLILQPEDVAEAVLFVCRLPPRAHVAEMVIKPTAQEFI